MKKALLPITLVTLVSVLIYSCSSDDDDSAPPSVIQTPEPETPAPTQYTLSVSAGEGGSVSAEGGNYDEGTEVTVTATPAEGYEFVGWEGINSEEHTLNITLNTNLNLNAQFERRFYITKKSELNVSKFILESNNTISELSASALFNSNLNGTIYVENQGNEFLVFPGIASCVGTLEDCQSLNDVLQTDKLPTIVFKKIDNKWVFEKYDNNGGMYSARNSDVKDNKILFADGNEIGEISSWRGPLVLGEIIGSTINFKEITPPQDYSYYHDAAFGGDLNNDGLFDIVGTIYKEANAPAGLGVFLQNQNGEFILNNSLIDYPLLDNGERLFNYMPFGIACKDLDGDNRAEIITYHTNDHKNNDYYNEISLINNPVTVYKFDESTNKYIYIPNDFYMNSKPWAATSIDLVDLNNDGVDDLIVNAENLTEDGWKERLEVWIGKGNNKFEFNESIMTDATGTPIYFDVNNDGFEDIIMSSYTKNGGINLFESLQFSENGAPCPTGLGDNNCLGWINKTREGGINFNSLIYLNDGKGNFNQYQNDLIIKDIVVDWFIPYTKESKLHFVGINVYDEDNEEGFDILRKKVSGMDSNDHKFVIYDIEINLF